MTRIFHIADLHFGTEDKALVENFIELCHRHKPDIVIAAGDFTQNGRKSEFEATRAFFARLPAPIVATPGNHDTPTRALLARLIHPWKRFRTVVEAMAQDALMIGGVQIETLNSARRAQMRLDWSLGDISKSDLTQLTHEFRKSSAHTRILTCHHPLLAPSGPTGRARTRHGLWAADHVAEVCDLVLTGHLHESFALPLKSKGQICWFIGASTAFSARTRDEPPGFNQIDITPEAHRLIHFASDGQGQFLPVKTVKLNRSAGTPHSLNSQ